MSAAVLGYSHFSCVIILAIGMLKQDEMKEKEGSGLFLLLGVE